MASTEKTRAYISDKVLPCVRRRVFDACVSTEPHFMGTEFMRVSFYTKLPEIFGSTEIPFYSTGRQKLVEDLVSAIIRKNHGVKIIPTPSGFLIACD